MNSGVADSELVADVPNWGLRVVCVDDHGSLRGREFVFAPALSTSGTGCCHSCPGAFPDAFALVLGECGDDVEVELAGCGRGVDSLGERCEADALLLKLGNEIIQLSHVAAETIKTPYHEGVSLS